MTGTPPTFEVVLRFRPGGPAQLGAWSEERTARHKFHAWTGIYATPGVQITLTKQCADGTSTLLDAWPHSLKATPAAPGAVPPG